MRIPFIIFASDDVDVERKKKKKPCLHYYGQEMEEVVVGMVFIFMGFPEFVCGVNMYMILVQLWHSENGTNELFLVPVLFFFPLVGWLVGWLMFACGFLYQ